MKSYDSILKMMSYTVICISGVDQTFIHPNLRNSCKEMFASLNPQLPHTIPSFVK